MPLFDDMLTSYRGAGTIATFLAGFVLVSLLLLSVLVLDPRFNGGMESSAGLVARQEREIANLTRELAAVEAKFDSYQQRKARQDALAECLRQEAVAKSRVSALSTRIEGHTEDLVAMRGRHDRYAQAYREHIRGRAVGEVLPTLTLPDGRVLESPQIVSVTPAGLQLRYSAGVVRIPVKDLPLSLCQRFQFSEAEAGQFLASEREQQTEFERDIDRSLAALDEASRQKRLTHLEGRIPFLMSRIEACSEELQRQRRKPLPHLKTVTELQDRIILDRRELLKAETELHRLRYEDRSERER